VTENFRDRLLTINEKYKFDKRSLDLKNLHDMQDTEKFKVKTSNGFAALDNLDESEDINRPWNNTKHSVQSQLKRV
jgi:hypothetical protein